MCCVYMFDDIVVVLFWCMCNLEDVLIVWMIDVFGFEIFVFGVLMDFVVSL